MTDKVRNKGGKQHCYSLEQGKLASTFDIINDMSEYVTLVQLVDNPVNLSYAVAIPGVWTFDANYKRYLTLAKQSLGLICVSSRNDVLSAEFERLYKAVRYANQGINKVYFR